MTTEQKRKINILGKYNDSINVIILEKVCIISDEEDKKESRLYECCHNCNKKIIQKGIGRKSKYCSNKCRHEYGSKNNNRKIYELVYEYCGKKYEALSMKRKYCSHDCYIRNKYWRKEDAEGIMNKILAGEKVESIPKWLKELLRWQN